MAGRNDPCPCGSGKKYKKCCLATDELANYTWIKMRCIEGELMPELLAYAKEHYGPEAILEAWDEFSLWDDIPPDPKTEMEFETSFLPWFVFNWVPDNTEAEEPERYPETQIALSYLAGKKEIEPMKRRFIEEVCSQPYSFFMVGAVEPGRRMTLRDLFLKQETSVFERRASTALHKGDIIFSRVVTLDDSSIMLGAAPLIIPASYFNVLLDFRDRVETAFGPFGKDLLQDYCLELREIYYDIKEKLYAPPQLANTDGEPLQFTTLYYSLKCPPQEAFDALKSLSLIEDDEELLAGAGFDDEGQLTSIDFPWQKKGNQAHSYWNNTIMGNLVIDGENLTIEVNSQERAEAVKRKIARHLGKKAVFKNALIQSVERMLEEGTMNPSVTPPEDEDLQNLPEVKEMMAEMAKKHWAAWMDEPIPALNGQTPRQAAKTPKGRERLEALLMEYEGRSARSSPRPFDPDIAALRQSLGIA